MPLDICDILVYRLRCLCTFMTFTLVGCWSSVSIRRIISNFERYVILITCLFWNLEGLTRNSLTYYTRYNMYLTMATPTGLPKFARNHSVIKTCGVVKLLFCLFWILCWYSLETKLYMLSFLFPFEDIFSQDKRKYALLGTCAILFVNLTEIYYHQCSIEKSVLGADNLRLIPIEW